MPFDLSMTKLLVLGVIAMVVFGPDKLPQVARDAGRLLRQFRAFAQQTQSQLKSELGDVVGDFDLEDLNPKQFVRKHLLEGFEDAGSDVRTAVYDVRTTLASGLSSPGTTAGAAVASAVLTSAAADATEADAVHTGDADAGDADAADADAADADAGGAGAAAMAPAGVVAPAPFDSDAT